jgi:DNA-binding LacI/PurR family transcriptional regulator
LRPLPDLTVPGDRAGAGGALRAFRAAHPAVTAIAAFDDNVALRILAAVGDLGLSVPRDLAVIGFDDTEHGALFTPALTTVHIDAEDHGRQAARTVLGLNGSGFVPAPARVIARESA